MRTRIGLLPTPSKQSRRHTKRPTAIIAQRLAPLIVKTGRKKYKRSKIRKESNYKKRRKTTVALAAQ